MSKSAPSFDEAPQHGLEMREGQQDMSFEIVDDDEGIHLLLVVFLTGSCGELDVYQ